MSFRSQKVWKVRLIIVVLALLTLGVAGYRFRGHLFSAFGYVTEGTGSKTNAVLSLALALCLLICLFSWLIFPIIFYFGLKDLRRRTAELDQTTQICAQLLGQLTTKREPSSEKKPQDQANV